MNALVEGIGTTGRHGRFGLILGLSVALISGCHGTPAEQAPAQIAATDPIAQDTPPPIYPLELACAGLGGQVILLLSVGADGTPVAVRTERSSRRKALDEAAMAAVQTWRFRPATMRGKPVAARIRVPVTFTPPVMRPELCFRFDEEQRISRRPG
ncbi:MAG: energy transducer TonB [Lysobacter sp.]